MYYSHPCSYCSRIFYTYNSSRHNAAKTLYYGIKQHLIDYGEDHKEFEFDDGAEIDINDVYKAAKEHEEPPHGGHEL